MSKILYENDKIRLFLLINLLYLEVDKGNIFLKLF